MKTKHTFKDKQYWLRQTERYFDAETSENEERELMAFAASPLADSPEFRELRATLSFFSIGKAKRHNKQKSNKLRFYIRTVAAAVVIAIVSVTGVWFATQKFFNKDVYVAYIKGNKTTNPEAVRQAMQSSIDEVMSPTGTPKMEQQLDDMFQTLDDSEQSYK